MSGVDLNRARAMRARGQSFRQIGDEFGVSHEWVRVLIGSEPVDKTCRECETPFRTTRLQQVYCTRSCAIAGSNARERGVCACGNRTASKATVCHECDMRGRQTKADVRRTRIAEMWTAGYSMKDIAEVIGTTTNALGGELVRMRAAGWDLPFRRPRKVGKPVTKQQARQQLGQAVRSGQLRRPSRCEQCGKKTFVDGHHHDYSRPLYVEWLCRHCHMAIHAEERKAA